MKIAINRDWGGFPHIWDKQYERNDPVLIQLVLDEAVEDLATVRVVEIPDEATDWDVVDYDGMEMVIYVLDGRLYYKWE